MEQLWLVLSIFLLILLLNRLKIDLGLSLILGALLLSFLSFRSISRIISLFWQTLTDWDTQELALLIILINLLGFLLNESGQLERMVDSLKSFFPDQRFTLSLIPSLIGLLVLPGGVILSAPIVQKIARRVGLSDLRAGFTNFWFRHLLHLILPLSQPLIIAVKLGNVQLSHLVKLQIAPLLVSGLVGWIVSFGGVKTSFRGEKERRDWLSLFLNGLPIFLTIVLVFFTPLPLPLTIFLSILVVFLLNRSHFLKLLLVIPKGISLNLLSLVIGVMFFRHVLEDAGLVEGFVSLGDEFRFPLPILLILVPFTVALVMGMSSGSLVLTLPLFIAGFFPQGMGAKEVMLVYVSSFLGYLLSPLHLCLTLSKEYFGLDLRKFYLLLLFPSLAVFLALGVTYWMLR